MASGPITSWKIDGETMETMTDFIFSGSKITADADCSHEIKRHLLPRRKAMTNLDSILKSRDISSPTKVHLVKAMVFPVVMYGCESWTCEREPYRSWWPKPPTSKKKKNNARRQNGCLRRPYRQLRKKEKWKAKEKRKDIPNWMQSSRE